MRAREERQPETQVGTQGRRQAEPHMGARGRWQQEHQIMMKLEPIIQSGVSQNDKHQYSILTCIYGIEKDGNDNPICKTENETQMYSTDFGTLWEKARVGCSERISLKQVYYQG